MPVNMKSVPCCLSQEMGAKTLWASLSILRIAWCLLPQTGYLHPDEFFQSPEVMAGDILDLDINRPWEFLPTFPCRTVVTPLLTSGAAFWIIKLLHHLDFKVTSACGYVLLVLPRLLITLLSFILDYTVFHIAPAWGSNRWNAMILLAGSYVTLVFYTRTISNAMEGIFLSVILLLTSPEKIHKAKSHHFIGIILAAGIFNRPTFAAFALVPVLFWAGKTKDCCFSYQSFVTNVLKLLPSSFSTSIIFISADTLWYKGWLTFTTQSSMEQLFQKTVLTPLNFLKYNLNPDNLAQHGTHPPITHVVVNGVVLFGILHVSVVFIFLKMLKRSIMKLFPKSQCNNNQNKEGIPQHTSLLFLIYFVPLILLSLVGHQEPRFLIPLLLPVVLLYSTCYRIGKMTCAIALFNIIGALFFGFLHQGGLIPSLFHIQQIVQSKPTPGESLNHYTILFTHTYMPPKHLLCLNRGQTHTDVVDLAGFDESQLCQKIIDIKKDLSRENVLPNKNRHHFLIVFPGTIAEVVENCGLVFTGGVLFAPHVSMEDPPTLLQLLGGNIKNYLGLHVREIDV
ncbi:GPI mannosyltransferase 4 [Pelobates cultripes]|uniref:Mannosyltransferase n=1 Tax=Pelobates cultripes TaxID=61616 RepID=A0AAD1RCF7_PELCU|nr:GPI mannosyltransferase 4 [Pelobates cultripes]